MYDGTNEGGYATGNITIIDKLEPTDVTFSGVTKTTQSITITATATDAAATSQYGQSKIKEIEFYYRASGGTNWEGKQTLNANTSGAATVTFSNLTQSTGYQIRAIARDNATNTKEVIYNTTVTTDTVPAATGGAITITFQNGTSWAKSTKATINAQQKNGYTVQYQLNSEGWKEYKAGTTDINITKLNDTVHARYYDGRQGGAEVSNKPQNIDNLTPNVPTLTATTVAPSSSSITITASASDQQATETSGMSNIRYYYYWDSNSNGWSAASSSKTKTYTGLKASTTYTFRVKVEDYAGNQMESSTTPVSQSTTAVPNLSGHVTITYNPNKWTNQAVTVTIATSGVTTTGYTLQYSTDKGSSWTAYQTGGFKVTNNFTTIYARLWDGTQGGGQYTSGQVTIIDREKPNVPTMSFGANDADVTTKSIKVTVSATDKEPTAVDGKSNIALYYFSKDNGTNWTAGTANNYYTFSDLDQSKGYPIKVKVQDNAGNVTEAASVTKTTKTVPAATGGAITITFQNGTNWAKSTKATINAQAKTGYTVQYYLNSGGWQEYKEGTTDINITKLNDTVHARYYDGRQGGAEVSNKPKNIDNLTPNVTNFTTTAGTPSSSSITVTISASDQNATAESGKSDIKSYYFYSSSTGTWTTAQNATSYTYNGLKASTQYNFKVKVEDKAGNVSAESAIKTQNTTSVPSLAGSNVTISYSPSTWTNQPVTVTISPGSSISTTGYTIEYSTNKGESWSTYNSSTKFKVYDNNTTIWARLTDNTNNKGNYGNGTVTIIDRLPPKSVTFTYTKTSSSIDITASATDEDETSTDGKSNIAKYYFSKDGGQSWEPAGGKTSKTHSFTGLSSSEKYTIMVKAEDMATNSSESSSEEISLVLYLRDVAKRGKYAEIYSNSRS